MAAFDVIAIVVLIAMGVRTAFKGFVAEFMTALSLIVGIGGAVLLTSRVSELLIPYIGATFWTPVVAFLLVFIVVYLLFKLLETSLHRLIDRIRLEKLDQSLGFFLGMVEGVILLAVILFFLELQSLVDVEGLFKNSIAADFIRKLIPIGAGFIEERLGDVQRG
ncbi:MAG: CvpA family protein [Spirochaetaceae bacterium]